MAIILSLETSSPVCSVCLHDGEDLLSIVETSEAFSHTRKITVCINECLEEANLEIQDLQAVAVSHGPGSYTGLRVAAATAKGICYGLDIPLIAVDTLASVAVRAQHKHPNCLYIPMLDARRMEVYNAVYDAGLKTVKGVHNLILEEGVYDEFKKNDLRIVLCGTGIEKAETMFDDETFIKMPFDLSSKDMIGIATQRFQDKMYENIVAYEPNYYKAPMVTKSKKPLF